MRIKLVVVVDFAGFVDLSRRLGGMRMYQIIVGYCGPLHVVTSLSNKKHFFRLN